MNLIQVVKEFRWQFAFTFSLILLEAAAILLFPLFIGFAIDDALQGIIKGSILLSILGILALVLGAGRRFFDSRFYAQVFQSKGAMIIGSMHEQQSSVKAARLGMINEMVGFLEDSLPELINSIIGLVGVVVIIASLNIQVFWGCILVTLVIFLVYSLTASKTLRLNRAYNNELETQVDVIHKNSPKLLHHHLGRVMRLNVQLSDLETVNFSVSWLALMLFLVAAILISAQVGMVKYGALFSLVMYIFQYIESIISLPLFYQQWLRLKEIRERLNDNAIL